MENTFFEFQAKGSHTPIFELKTPRWEVGNIMAPIQKMVPLKDGERIIAKVVDSVLNTFTNETYMQIEDIDGNKSIISSKNFHKITDPKQFSKKFKLFKIQNHILDA
jgi:hypothetical protein